MRQAWRAHPCPDGTWAVYSTSPEALGPIASCRTEKEARLITAALIGHDPRCNTCRHDESGDLTTTIIEGVPWALCDWCSDETAYCEFCSSMHWAADVCDVYAGVLKGNLPACAGCRAELSLA